jgi:hypothetical protein
MGDHGEIAQRLSDTVAVSGDCQPAGGIYTAAELNTKSHAAKAASVTPV